MSRELTYRLLGALGMLAAFGCRDTSLVDVVENHPDEFPPPYVAITPPSQASALGLQAVAVPSDGEPRRQAVLTSARCFFVVATESKRGLDDYVIRYHLAKDLHAELDVVAANVGVDLDAARRVTLALEQLRVEQARLVPNPDGCDFSQGGGPQGGGPEGASFEVFTQQVVAGRVALDFGTDMNFAPSVEVPIANTAATVGVAGGWKVASSKSLSGEDIVIAAMPERWAVRVSRSTHLLGPSPQAGEYAVPDTTARVSVIAYDANRPALKLQVNTTLNQDAKSLPDGWGKLGETFELELERSQRNFLPEPGNRSITVRWRRRPADDEPDITVIELELESLVATPM
jgi:hypothetical protein